MTDYPLRMMTPVSSFNAGDSKCLVCLTIVIGRQGVSIDRGTVDVWFASHDDRCCVPWDHGKSGSATNHSPFHGMAVIRSNSFSFLVDESGDTGDGVSNKVAALVIMKTKPVPSNTIIALQRPISEKK